jgi:hypothetical protein
VTIDGVRLDIGFIVHLYTPFGTRSNYRAIADLHTLQITAINTKPSAACSVFNSRFLVTDVSGDSATSRAQVLLSRFQYRTACQLSTEPVNSGWGSRYIASGQTQQKTPPPTGFFCYGLLPSDSSDAVDMFTGRYQETGLILQPIL